MANYVKATNFAVKDTLATGNPSKIVKGTEIDAELTAIASAISSKPDADSPTLTGTPLAPTATVATNNTQISTTAYVVNRIAQDIAGKANIASPTFTGTPAAPTAAAGTNTTQIATTAFVKDAIDTAVGDVDSGVLTFSAGTTGLTPSTATAGAIVLAGTLAVANGGTGSGATYTNGQLLIGNTTGGTLNKATLTAGTGISVTNGAGSITIANTLPSSVNAQVFTTVGASTFTIPTGVTKLKVTVVGGGGGGGPVGVIGGTTSGGTSSVASGTQSITTISATGGAAGTYPFGNIAAGGSGGLGSNGDLNIGGNGGDNGSVSPLFAPAVLGGSSILGGGGINQAGRSYGGGGSGQGGSNPCGTAYGGSGGGGGGAAIKWLSSLTPGNTLSVTVGAAGSAVAGAYAGAAGVVIFEW